MGTRGCRVPPASERCSPFSEAGRAGRGEEPAAVAEARTPQRCGAPQRSRPRAQARPRSRHPEAVSSSRACCLWACRPPQPAGTAQRPPRPGETRLQPRGTTYCEPAFPRRDPRQPPADLSTTERSGKSGSLCLPEEAEIAPEVKDGSEKAWYP